MDEGRSGVKDNPKVFDLSHLKDKAAIDGAGESREGGVGKADCEPVLSPGPPRGSLLRAPSGNLILCEVTCASSQGKPAEATAKPSSLPQAPQIWTRTSRENPVPLRTYCVPALRYMLSFTIPLRPQRSSPFSRWES